MSDEDARVPHIDLRVDISSQESVDSGAREVMGRVRPEWSNVGIKVFSAGVTNKLVGAYDVAASGDKYDDMVLVRYLVQALFLCAPFLFKI